MIFYTSHSRQMNAWLVAVLLWNVSSGLEYSINCGYNVLVNIKYGLRSHIMQNNAKQASLVVQGQDAGETKMWNVHWS